MAGCTNHGCLIEKPQGMGTNGRCRCLEPLGRENESIVRGKLIQLGFYKTRMEELERHKGRFPEPYLTMICNILANGKIEP